MPFPKSPGSFPRASRYPTVRSKIFQIDSWEKIRAPLISKSRSPETAYLLLPASQCESANDEERVIQLDDTKLQSSLPFSSLSLSLPSLFCFFPRLISTDFHNGSMYEYARPIFASGHFPPSYRTS